MSLNPDTVVETWLALAKRAKRPRQGRKTSMRAKASRKKRAAR
jgi:hypothetical protein